MSAPSLPEFAEMVGMPLRRWQAAALALTLRMTVIVAPRQTGKSYSLALLALWWAMTKPGQTVLIVSAGEEAAKRLLGTIRDLAALPLLRGSTVDESQSLLTLTNGSTVRSLPQSERAIRGWSADLLIVDEAAMVTDDVLQGAALPTTAARPDARVVLASSPWTKSRGFYRYASAGNTEWQRVFRWRLADAEWISKVAIDSARATLSPARFRAEYEGEFVDAEDAYFDTETLLRAVAPYRQLSPADARGEAVVIGLDHGRAYDRHAIVALGVLDDHGRNEQPVLFVPFAETSQRSYPDQMAVVIGMARKRRTAARLLPGLYDEDGPLIRNGPLTIVRDARLLTQRPASLPPLPEQPGYGVVQVVSEMNGVGYAVTEELQQRMRPTPVVGMHTTQRNKEEWMSRLRAWLAQGRLILPDDEELLRQLRGLTYTATESGGLTIAASNAAIHDDLAMGLAMAASAIGPTASLGAPGGELPDTEWLTTGSGRYVPASPRPRFSGLRSNGSRLVTW